VRHDFLMYRRMRRGGRCRADQPFALRDCWKLFRS